MDYKVVLSCKAVEDLYHFTLRLIHLGKLKEQGIPAKQREGMYHDFRKMVLEAIVKYIALSNTMSDLILMSLRAERGNLKPLRLLHSTSLHSQ